MKKIQPHFMPLEYSHDERNYRGSSKVTYREIRKQCLFYIDNVADQSTREALPNKSIVSPLMDPGIVIVIAVARLVYLVNHDAPIPVIEHETHRAGHLQSLLKDLTDAMLSQRSKLALIAVETVGRDTETMKLDAQNTCTCD